MASSHKTIAAGKFFFKEPKKHATRLLPHHVFLYIEFGEWDIHYHERTFKIHAGDVVLMPSDVLHSGVSMCTPGTCGIYLHCSPCEGDGLTDFIGIENDFIYLPCVIHLLEHAAIQKVFSQIAEYYNSSITYKMRICDSLFDNLLLLLQNQDPNTKKILLHRIDEIFHLNSDKILTNAQIAKKMNFSQKYLERSFKTEMGKSVHQYQIETKINKAKELMKIYPDITLTEVALMLGFYDSSHFSKVFKKQQGVSPNTFFIETKRNCE